MEAYPFVGRWDCGVEVFTFTDSTYDNGTQTAPIRNVTRDGRNFTLLFDGGYVIALAAVTDTGLTWVSGKTGDQLACRRLSRCFRPELQQGSKPRSSFGGKP